MKSLNTTRNLAWFATMVVALFAVAGCTSERKQAPAAETKVVVAHGLTLDENATPQQVAYVLLRALKDDVDAAQAFKHDEQRAAIDLAFSLAAYDAIEQKILAIKKKSGDDKPLGEQRNEILYELSSSWAIIVAHYVKSFDTEFDAAAAKMTVKTLDGGRIMQVHYPVAHDPEATDPDQRQDQVLNITLAQESDSEGHEFWRVVRLDYLAKRVAAPIPEPTPEVLRPQ